MDGYTKAAIAEALAKRSSGQRAFDEAIDRVLNGAGVYLIGTAFYGFWGFVLWYSIMG